MLYNNLTALPNRFYLRGGAQILPLPKEYEFALFKEINSEKIIHMYHELLPFNWYCVCCAQSQEISANVIYLVRV